eukprot:NODE_1706_length_906_cov_6.185531_g1188_i0.p8 GENE.NODE_1706_length_906_cov_6.185531_g1188_i0~~NODE_1706_length_906_cov_6.185531_g1188_i0.p8  ORF type:complete len:55 (-),score=16.36 NODE_1706_length_906_cov_6.185531_g1188_i0:134-298(-)
MNTATSGAVIDLFNAAAERAGSERNEGGQPVGPRRSKAHGPPLLLLPGCQAARG